MKLTQSIDPSAQLSFDEWIDELEDVAEDNGFFEPLGPDHSATFIDGSPFLLVTFETVESARERAENDVPLGWAFSEAQGWSQLCILSHGETWFRHNAVYAFFDRLVDEGFFDEYENIVFHGSRSCGYAAAAYSVAAPGATVIAHSPQASLSAGVAGWDSRFKKHRRKSFTKRYGFAPDMLDGANVAYIVFDPHSRNDAAHAAIFKRDHVNLIPLRFLGNDSEGFLRRMDHLTPLIVRAMARKLQTRHFFEAYRERHHYLPYLRAHLKVLVEANRHYLAALFCRSVLKRINAPRFKNQLKASEAILAENEITLPKSRELNTR